jgi:hypothetical protein
MAVVGDKSYKSVATWIPMKDFALLQHLAFLNKVTVASYIRGIINDAIADEIQIRNIKTDTTTENQQVV